MNGKQHNVGCWHLSGNHKKSSSRNRQKGKWNFKLITVVDRAIELFSRLTTLKLGNHMWACNYRTWCTHFSFHNVSPFFTVMCHGKIEQAFESEKPAACTVIDRFIELFSRLTTLKLGNHMWAFNYRTWCTHFSFHNVSPFFTVMCHRRIEQAFES
jgi:uncharacterized membrane protein YkvI